MRLKRVKHLFDKKTKQNKYPCSRNMSFLLLFHHLATLQIYSTLWPHARSWPGSMMGTTALKDTAHDGRSFQRSNRDLHPWLASLVSLKSSICIFMNRTLPWNIWELAHWLWPGVWQSVWPFQWSDRSGMLSLVDRDRYTVHMQPEKPPSKANIKVLIVAPSLRHQALEGLLWNYEIKTVW